MRLRARNGLSGVAFTIRKVACPKRRPAQVLPAAQINKLLPCDDTAGSPLSTSLLDHLPRLLSHTRSTAAACMASLRLHNTDLTGCLLQPDPLYLSYTMNLPVDHRL